MFNSYVSDINSFSRMAARDLRFANEAAARNDKITEMRHRNAAIQTEALIANLVVANQKVGR